MTTQEQALDKAKSYKALTGTPIDDDIIEAFESALTELAEIKKVVENWDEGEYYTDSIHSMKKIEDILKGEKK